MIKKRKAILGSVADSKAPKKRSSLNEKEVAKTKQKTNIITL